MTNVFETRDQCCGCSACEAVCCRNAISLVPDREGFLYPEVNRNLCVSCGECKRVCAFNVPASVTNLFEQKYYYARSKDDRILLKSSSGGVFSQLYVHFLRSKGAVCGAVFSDGLSVKHEIAFSETDCKKMRGSKYVQSDINSLFRKIKTLLERNYKVLFTGTPCQVDGLKSFLKHTDLTNLVTIDIICHGVPSPLVWRDYIHYLEQKYHSGISNFSFRDKEKGWRGFNVSVKFKDKTVLEKSRYTEAYIELYGQGAVIRPSCYKCKYSSLLRPSDITIGDFWGIEQLYPEIDDDKGASMMLVNTQKGEDLFQEISDCLNWFEVTRDDILFKQPNLKKATVCNVSREKFWKLYAKGGFIKVGKRYTQIGIWNYLKEKGKAFVKRLILKR